MRDMYFLYDELSRVTCRRTTSGSICPTSGTSLGENISYNASACEIPTQGLARQRVGGHRRSAGLRPALEIAPSDSLR